MSDRIIPDMPLEFIRKCILDRKILWTYHVNMRLQERHITRDQILNSLESYEILEKYPEDKHLPSYLLYAVHEAIVFHIVVAADARNENIRIVTAYYPDPNKWEQNLKTRRKNL